MNEQYRKKLLKIIIILGLISALTSIYLLKNHYVGESEGSICDFSSLISCSFVNASQFSEIFNVPVALLGIIWSLGIIYLAKKSSKRQEDHLTLGLYILSIVGIISVIYFIIAEIILKALCPFCTIIHIASLLILILSLKLYKVEHIKTDKHLIKKLKKPFYTVLILTLIIMLGFNIFGGPKENYDELAQCLTENEVTMYGSYRCGHCLKNKDLLGDSFQYVNYVECHPFGPSPQTELCEEKEIEGTPTWIKEDSEGDEIRRETGYININNLKAFSGCE